ncbi:MAG: hypothetical protein H7269_12430, partial [Cellulomonas sp.]|nr:hypothetical protein [Cellulomonas sp.]
MTTRRQKADLPTAGQLPAEQWPTLRTWLGWLLDDADGDGLWPVPAFPSVLPG